MNWPAPTPGDQCAVLAGLLRAHAAGLTAELAAVELLIAHRHWLTRPEFTSRFVHHITSGGRHTGAWVDWPAVAVAVHAGQLPCSASQRHMLAIAASLAADCPVVLGEVLGGLDRANITAVTAAITTANPT